MVFILKVTNKLYIKMLQITKAKNVVITVWGKQLWNLNVKFCINEVTVFSLYFSGGGGGVMVHVNFDRHLCQLVN